MRISYPAGAHFFCYWPCLSAFSFQLYWALVLSLAAYSLWLIAVFAFCRIFAYYVTAIIKRVFNSVSE